MLVSALTAAAVAASTVNVAVKDDVFVKDAITVKRGSTVRWTWKGKSKHDVTVVKGPKTFRSSLKRTGSYSRKLTRKGTYKLVCTVHAPDMKMTITVK